jgi:FAD-dependent oxidoreductase domain-containing protein 1
VTDAVVIGGGIIGSSTALYLLLGDPGLRVEVIEPDPTYALAATPLASGGVRQLFSRPENVALSRHTLDVIARWPEFAAVDGEPPPDLQWRRQGYLFIATRAGTDALAANLETQRALGVDARWLEPSELGDRYPVFATSDLGPAVLSPDDGWLDPHAFLQGMRRKAQSLGATFREDRVVGLEAGRGRVRRVELASGGALAPAAVVNAAGCWAPELSAQVGMPVPVEPMRRFEHAVHLPPESQPRFASLPFVKDPEGLAIRPEGQGLSVGLVDFRHPGGFDHRVDHSYFERRVWPALAHRCPGLDRLRLHATTVGHYDQNRLDGNPILGSWPGRLDNYYLATGFSGHGMMHAPGVGRALAELILHGRYQTLDLERFGYERILREEPYAERGIR